METDSFCFTALVLLSVAGAAIVHAQSALDGVDRNANGNVRAVLVQPDGARLLRSCKRDQEAQILKKG
jgi:hypothetical protein